MRRQKLFRTPYLYDAGGDIQKPWWIEFGYRDPKDGKMKRKRYQEGFAELRTKKARIELADVLIKSISAKLQRGWTPLDDSNNQVVYVDELEYHQAAMVYGRKRKANKNIRFYASEYITQIKDTKAKKTFESYRGKIREFIAWLEKSKLVDNDLSTFDNAVIHQFFDYLISERKLAKPTVEKYRITLCKFFRHLINRKILVEHPVHDIDIPETDEDFSAMPFLDDDLEKLLPAIRDEDPQLFLAALLQYYCFIRPGNELLGLQVKHVNFSARTIFVPKNIAKKRKERVVDIPNKLFDILQLHGIQAFGKEMFVIGPNGRPGKRQIGINTLRNRFNLYRENLGLSISYKWYSFKHTGAGKLLESGATLVELMNQLGHSDLASTYRYVRQHFGERSEHVRDKFPDPPGL
ncbi:tyrosine-type recombinase/integrase [Mangrovibacterium sp.]|uniref:tyrosine-type recombinase/integrase n=1 Tax=Mangrovibacterium sp. TaxID=1961364 RepID=UPI00356654F3